MAMNRDDIKITALSETNEAAVAVQDDPACQADINESLPLSALMETPLVKVESLKISNSYKDRKPKTPTVCQESLQAVEVLHDGEIELTDPTAMTNDELATVVIDGMQKLRRYLPYVITLHQRFRDGERDSANRLIKPIRDCHSFAEFCVNRCYRTPQAIYKAMSDALKPTPKQIGNGGKKTSKEKTPPTKTITVKDGTYKEAVDAEVEKQKDAAFEQGRAAERAVKAKQAPVAEDKSALLALADTFARNIAACIAFSGSPLDTKGGKKSLKAARKAAVQYCKLRGISFLAEPVPPAHKARKAPGKSAKQVAAESEARLKAEPSQARPAEPLDFVTDGSLVIGHTYSENSKGTAPEIEFVTPKQHAALSRRHGVV